MSNSGGGSVSPRDESSNFHLKRTEGYLSKKGGAVNKGLGGRRNWLKRWFVLEKSPGRNGKDVLYTLHYFESQKGKQKGSIDLNGTEIFFDKKSQHTNKNVKYEFQIQLQNGSLLYLSADTFQERDEWIESLNYAITSMRKPVVERPTFIKAAHAGYDPNLDDKEENYELGRDIAQHCQAYGSGLYGAEAGQPAEFMIQLYDPNGNQLTTGGLPFTANLYDDTCLYHIGVHDNRNGTLSSFYVVSRPGRYELSILLNDEHHIYGSPFQVEVLPSHTDPASCLAFGDCLHKLITPEVPTSFTIVAMDSYGNKKQRGGDPFEVGVMGPAKLLGLEDKGDGTYVCTLEASYPRDQPYITSSTISIIVTLNGKSIQGSPFRSSIDLSARPNQSMTATMASSSSSTAAGGAGATTGNRLQHPGALDQRNGSNQTRGPPNSSMPRQQQLGDKGPPPPPANNPRPPLNIPPGTNKLEAARMRAVEAAKDLPSNPQDLVARAMQERNSNENSSSHHGSRQRNSALSSTNPSLNHSEIQHSETKPSSTSNSAPPPAANTKLTSRMSRLDQMTQKLGTSKVFQAQQNNQNISNGGGSRASLPPPPPPTELIESLSAGLLISPPDDLPNELRRLWSITHEALCTREIVNLLASNTVALQSSFNLASEPPAYRLSFLISETGQSAGLYKVFEEFDVIPSYMSKKELKLLFDLIIRSQAHSGPPASFVSSQGKDGIEFMYFLKLLILVCVYCLSKTPAFSSLYSTVKAKADVMLFNWGFADPLKIKSVQNRLHRI